MFLTVIVAPGATRIVPMNMCMLIVIVAVLGALVVLDECVGVGCAELCEADVDGCVTGLDDEWVGVGVCEGACDVDRAAEVLGWLTTAWIVAADDEMVSEDEALVPARKGMPDDAGGAALCVPGELLQAAAVRDTMASMAGTRRLMPRTTRKVRLPVQRQAHPCLSPSN